MVARTQEQDYKAAVDEGVLRSGLTRGVEHSWIGARPLVRVSTPRQVRALRHVICTGAKPAGA